MKITALATINAHYPTVQYGNADVNFSIGVEEEFPAGTDIEAAKGYVSAIARAAVQREWLKLRDEVESNLVVKLARILPDSLEQQLISTGRIKR